MNLLFPLFRNRQKQKFRKQTKVTSGISMNILSLGQQQNVKKHYFSLLTYSMAFKAAIVPSATAVVI